MTLNVRPRRASRRAPFGTKLLPRARDEIARRSVLRFGNSKRGNVLLEEALLLRSPWEPLRIDTVVTRAIEPGHVEGAEATIVVELNLATGDGRVAWIRYRGERVRRRPTAERMTDDERDEAVVTAWEMWSLKRLRAGLEEA